MTGKTNAMSVDVEDWFQVSAFESHIDRKDWNKLVPRVEANTKKILNLFDDAGIKATFFTLGWVAERFPQLIKEIVSQGHELACHGYSHVRVTEQNPQEFREDVKRAKEILEDMVGVPVIGYRAASYSIGRDNLWALEILQDLGFRYSSSIYPVKHDLYGMPEAPRFAFFPENAPKLLEIPVTTVKLGGRNFPCGGGGYFRLYPYFLSKWALKQVNQEGQSTVFYFHPWEVDPQQPRPQGLSLKTRLRHYLNLNRMESRLRSLLEDFKWDTMANVFLAS
ncbi:MAG: polysaccharide deacetylase [Methylothermaceae bacteria B42]|nr:MAG: polysaccharide deacetylase [Methylothermaceae bacteria B42]